MRCQELYIMVTPHVHPRDPGQKLSSLIHLDAFAALDDGAVHPVTKPATARLVFNVRGWDFKPRKKPVALTVQQYRSGLCDHRNVRACVRFPAILGATVRSQRQHRYCSRNRILHTNRLRTGTQESAARTKAGQ